MKVLTMFNRYILLFAIIEVLVIGYFFSHFYEKRALHHAEAIHTIQNSFEAAIHAYEMSNDSFYAQHADIMARMLHQAPLRPATERDEIRQAMLEQFGTFYNDQKLFSLVVLHVIDAQGDSFLRFHAPKVHGDSIATQRYSLAQITKTMRYQHGLEVGVFREAYRFQYPLFYGGHYVGAYEYGIGFDAIIRTMEKTHPRDYAFFLRSEAVDALCRCNVMQQRYETLTIGEERLYRHRESSYRRYSSEHLLHLMGMRAFQERLAAKTPGVIDYWYDFAHHSVVVLPLSDIEGNTIAFFIAKLTFTHGEELLKSLLIDMALALALGFALSFVYFKEWRHQRYIRDILNTQKDIIIVTDGINIHDANTAMLDFFGYPSLAAFTNVHDCICDYFVDEPGLISKEHNGVRWVDYILSHPHEEHLIKMYDRALKEERIFLPQIERFKSTGTYVVSLKDQTDAFRRRQELEIRASHDALTQIYNRSKFDELLERELQLTQRYQTDVSVIMFDIDHFKRINDTHGHDVGDKVLQALSRLVQNNIRDVDIFARWGGEEFMIITRTPLDQAYILAEKLRRLCSSESFEIIGSMSCSFGVAHYHPTETKNSLLKRCDTLLYRAKTEGRNRVIAKEI